MNPTEYILETDWIFWRITRWTKWFSLAPENKTGNEKFPTLMITLYDKRTCIVQNINFIILSTTQIKT